MKSWSRLALYGLPFLFLLFFFIGGRWNKSKVIEADVTSYYSYLPALFIYGDVGMEYAHHSEYFRDKVWGVVWSEGKFTQKYTMGMAFTYAPFFLAGHVSALVSGEVADGYSGPYRFWLQLSAVLWLFLGLLYLRRLLLRYFEDRVAALVMVGLALGTNLFYYTAVAAPMPHAVLFFLITLFAWRTVCFFEQPDWRSSLWLGLVGGLIVLIRPNHLLIWMIPLLYGVGSVTALKERLVFFWTHRRLVIIWPLCLFILFLPQMFYWQYVKEEWLYWSYGDEGFFWDQPRFGAVLFSFRKGWLLYTPLMAFAVTGLFLMRRKVKEWSWGIGLLLLLSLYVAASWWCWWYGGTFGQRTFIDLYGLLALPLGAFLAWMYGRLPRFRWAPVVLIGLFCLLNVFQSFQYSRGLIHHDSMTARAYFAVFGKWNAPEGLEEMLDEPDYEKALRGEEK